MSNKTTFFQMTPDAALQAFELFKELGLKTEKERVWLLMELAKVRNDMSMGITGRSKEQIIQDYAKRFNVLHVKKKEE